MINYAWDYPWSSVHAHLSGKDKFRLVDTKQMSSFISDWKGYLLDAQSQSIEDFAKHERTGRPLGSDRFIEMAESLLTESRFKKEEARIKSAK